MPIPVTGGSVFQLESDPTTDVSVTSGLVAAYQADESVGLGAGSPVTGWLDGSGRRNDLVAPGNPQFASYLQNKYAAQTAPVVQDDAFVFAEDSPVAGNVLADNGAGADSDPNGDPLAVTLVADAEHGTLVLNGNGSFSYTPDKDLAGVDHFDYQISDGKGGTDRATVTLTATPVSDPAVAADDSYTATPGTTLTVAAAAGLLANDSDPDGDPLTATLQTNVAHGALALNRNGSFNYTPAAGFVGTDSFTYRVTDDETATVRIALGTPELVSAGLVARYESDNVRLLAGSTSTVAVWNDGTGNRNNLFGKGGPQLVEDATPTGAAAVAFDGINDLFLREHAINPITGFATGAADRTLFFVVDYKDSQGVLSGLVYGDAARNQAFGLVAKESDLAINGYRAANNFASGEDALAGGFLVQSVVLDENVLSHYRNGELIDTESHTFQTDLQKLIFGGAISGAGQSELEIAGALVYNRALTEPERTDVEAYLQQKYIGPDDLVRTELMAGPEILRQGTIGAQEWGAGVFLTGYGLDGSVAEVRYSEEFQDHGFGVSAPGSRWEGQIDFYAQPGKASEKLMIDFRGEVTGVIVSVGMLGATEGPKVNGLRTPETGAWSALDASGAVVDTGLIGPEYSTGKISDTYGVYPIEIDTDGRSFVRLEISATQFNYGSGQSTTERYGENSSDFNIMSVEFSRVDDDALL